MILYTYEDSTGNAVHESSATTNFIQARDHAAAWRLRLIENAFEFSDSEMVEDYTPEDESDV